MSDLPQPSELSDKDKEDAMGAYLMVFGALHLGVFPFLGLIVSWIYHGINGKKSPFVGFHSLQSLLFSIPSSLIGAIWMVWGAIAFVNAFNAGHGNLAATNLTAFWVYTWFNVLAYLVYVIYSIVGAVQSRKGRLVYFPVIGRLAYHRYFGAGRKGPRPEVRNEPPKGF